MSQLQVEYGVKVEAELMNLDPQKSESQISLRNHVERFKEQKNSELMLRALRKLADVEASFENFQHLADLEFEAGNYVACIQCVEKALEKRSGQLQGLQTLYRLKGASLIHLGLLDQAEDCLYQALEHPGAVDQVLVNLGTLDIQRKSWESATVSFREAINHNAKNDKAWVGLALCHRYRGDHELAFGNLELALDINPKNETALGLLLAWYGESKEVSIQHHLLEYLLSGGESAHLWLAFVEISSKRGEVDIAKIELERLRLTHPEFMPAYQLRF
ncbi:MAG: hypothetical protein CL676_06705 [Bdellovibrionaceae bacterium]|nr:hypothetical protein [Pseudobdellovibrionaceae bacterium]